MKSLPFFLLTLLMPLFSTAQTNPNHVSVQGHYRTAPNSTVNDNFSTIGNVNPYTGEVGTLPREPIYTNSIPEYTFATQTNRNSISAPYVKPRFQTDAIIIDTQNRNELDSSEPPRDVSKPMYGTDTEESLWEIAPEKPSLEKWETDLDKEYVQSEDGTYRLKKDSTPTGIYLFIGICFLVLISFFFKRKA